MKKINVSKPTIPIKEMFFEMLMISLSHNYTNNGKKHAALSERLKNYLNIQHVTLFTNGHLALEAALEMFEHKGGEIITTPFTFSSTTQAIIRKGFYPIFCDIDRKNFTIDPKQIESLITKNTVAILPVHVFGNVCDVEAIEEISKRYNLPVLYDSAHAFGVKYKSKSISEFGTLNMFSFHATKVFHTVEGGALTYNNSIFEARLNALKNFGIDTNGVVSYSGGNAKMNEFQAVVGLSNLKRIEKLILKRKKITQLYDSLLNGLDGIELYKRSNDVESNYAYYPILVVSEYKTVPGLLEYLESNNVYARRYFYPLTSDFPIFKDQFDSNKTPVAKYVSERVLCLPIYDSLKSTEVKYVTSKVKEYMEQ